MRCVPLALLACLVLGCKGGKLEANDNMKAMSASVSKGMKQEDVQRALGEPDKKMNDPTSGIEMWSYHAKTGNGTLLVSFSVDEVTDVRSTGL